MNTYQSTAVNQIFLCMQCFSSIILTISFLLKLLSLCGFRALSLLLLQIKFPQWFVSFEKAENVYRLNVRASVSPSACVCACASACTRHMSLPMHTCWLALPVHVCVCALKYAQSCACSSSVPGLSQDSCIV